MFHGADEACAATVDAADEDELDDRAGPNGRRRGARRGAARRRRRRSRGRAKPGAAHVDVIEALARAKAKEADAERDAPGA